VPARDFIEALVARYESQIEELKQEVQSLLHQQMGYPRNVLGN
jgi:phage host-nuclease inhibitor protein Gam